MKQNRNLEVLKNPTYSYDIIVSACTIEASAGQQGQQGAPQKQYIIQSNYGYYKGSVNEKKHKDGKGTFLFGNSTYSGGWVDDKREGDGVLLLNEGYTKLGLSTSGAGGNTSYSITDANRGKIEESFASVDGFCSDLTGAVSSGNLKSLQSKDYYSGKWINGKANGIGTLHFSKDNTSHEDFYRSGVVIRYVNQNNVFLPLVENGQFNLNNKNNDSKEILKEMIEDWKRVIGTDDDFPAVRPYLSSVTSSQSSYPISNIQQANNNSDYDLKTHLLQHSYTQAQLGSNNVQNKEQAPQSTNQTKSSYGIITANYLRSRLESEERFFLTLVMFISKWEIPIKNFSHTMVQNVNFLIVVPDLETASFSPLSNLIIKSNILEKLANKLIKDPIIRANILNEQQTVSISATATPTTETPSLGSVTVPQPSSTSEERELWKLIPLCIDLDEDPDVQKRNIQSILNILKTLPKQMENPNSVPEFLLQHIGDMLSIFKKQKPLESYLFTKQYNNAKEFLIKILNGENPLTPVSSPAPRPKDPKNETTVGVSGNSSPNHLSNKTVTVGASTDNSHAHAPINNTSTTTTTTSTHPRDNKEKAFLSSTSANATVSPSKLGKTFLSKTNISKGPEKSSRESNNNNGVVIGNNLSKSSAPSKSVASAPASSTNIGPPLPPNVTPIPLSREPKYLKTLDSIRQFNSSKSNLLELKQQKELPKDQPKEKPIEISNQHMNILFNLFKSTYQFPSSLGDSISYLKKINSNLSNIKAIITKKVNIIKETKSKKGDRKSFKELNNPNDKIDQKVIYSYKEYLYEKDFQIEQFINQLEKEVIILVAGYGVCEELCKLLYSQQILLSLKRLRMAVTFIRTLKSHQSKIPKDSLVQFIKHIYKIANMLLSSCHPISGGAYQSMPMISLEETIKDSVKSFMTSSNEIFSMIPTSLLNAPGGNTSPLLNSPDKPSSPSTFSLNSLLSGMFSSAPSNTSKSPTMVPTTPPNQPLAIDLSSSSQFEPNDISPGPFSFISPLNKIPEEIQSGQYHFILPIASSGDEILVSILSNSLIDIRSNFAGDKLKQQLQKSTQLFSLFQILIHSLTICPLKSYRIEALKTVTPISSHYPDNDHIFNEYKRNLFLEFMEIASKDEQFLFSAAFCSFFAQLYKGLSKDNKAEFVEIYSIYSFIDMLEKSTKSKAPGSEQLRAQSAQVLINLAVSSDKNLIELKKTNSLAVILDLCKLGQIFAHQQIDEHELQVQEFLGAGALAKVHKGLYNGKDVAIKIFNEGSYSFRLEDFLKEVAIMGLLTHPNLLKLEGACIIPRNQESTFMIVTELMHKGTLWDLIKKSHPLSTQAIVKHALSVACGLSYLHSLDMIHRDIKAANILVDRDDNAKVGDFGLSRVVSTFNMTAVAGTPKWESPEILAGEQYTSASDVYSYGMMLYELVSGEEPFPEIQTIIELVRTVYEKKLKPKIPATCPTFLANLIKDCLNNSPKKRPTMDQVIGYLQTSSLEKEKPNKK